MTKRIRLPGGGSLPWAVLAVGLGATAAVATSPRLREPLALAVLGSLLSVLLFALVRLLARSNERALGLASEQVGRALDLEQHLQSLAATPAGIFRLDADGRLAFANRRFEQITGRIYTELLGRSWLDLVHPEDRPAAAEGWEVAAKEGRELSRQVRLSGLAEERWVACRLARLTPRRGIDTGWVGSFEDVTAHRRLEAELARRALHDPLTGLPNRVQFLERLQEALARAGRSGTGVAVLFLDLDDFKVVNDNLGHAAGDRVLEAVGKRLAAIVRAGETVARYGGDEFTVLCEDVGDSTVATAVARRLARELERPLDSMEGPVRVRASVGIAISPDGATPPEELLRAADEAMYRAKADRDLFRVVDEAGPRQQATATEGAS